MAEIALAAESRAQTGTRPAGRLRNSGKIPGVVYGHGIDPIPVTVEGRALRAALTTDAGLNALLNLDVAGTNHLAMAKSVQRDPVRNVVVHVDFQVVRRDEVMTVDVQVVLLGEALEVTRGDGVVDQQMHSLTINATPDRIPSSLEVDISGLAIGDQIRVADVALPEGVTTDADPEQAVVIGQPPRAAEPSDTEGAEGEAAEGETGGAAASASTSESGGEGTASEGTSEGEPAEG